MGRTVGKKSGGPSTTMPVSLRLSPRVHYGLTLLARKRRTTVTSVVELAIERAIKSEVDGLVERFGKETINMLDETWDVDEADRFVKLARGYDELLSFEEQQLWKEIVETPKFWLAKGRPDYKAIRSEWPALEAKHFSKDKE